MKKLVCFLFFFLLFVLPAAAETGYTDDMEQYYDEQLELSGAEDLPDSLPDETRVTLDRLGLGEIGWESFANLNPGAIFGEIFSQMGEQSATPLKAALSILAVMLLCALMEGMKLSFGERPLGGIIGAVSVLCICGVILSPLLACIAEAANTIKGASGFLLAYVPVVAGIMIAGGQAVSAASYHLLMMGAGEVVSLASSGFIVPLLNVFLGLSIVSSVSPKLSFSGVCDLIHRIVKWVLGLTMTIFISILTVQSLVGTAADGTGSKTLKFVLSSFVPVVGGALSEALGTVQGCLKLLKSGVGAFGMLAAGFIFVPILLKCLMWMLSLHVCAAVGDIFELTQISSLLRAVGKVVSMLMSILLCVMTVLIISTVLVLIIGGATG